MRKKVKTIELITNHFTSVVNTIGELYKCRWQVEILFPILSCLNFYSMEKSNQSKFALYLNQAQHNTEKILKEVMRKFDEKYVKIIDKKGESFTTAKCLHEFLKDETSPTEIERLFGLLSFNFPLLTAISKSEADKTENKIRRFMLMLILLNDFRNFYSHYDAHPKTKQGFITQDYLSKDLEGVNKEIWDSLLIVDKKGVLKQAKKRNLLIQVRKDLSNIFKICVDDVLLREHFKHSDKNKTNTKDAYRYIKEKQNIDSKFGGFLVEVNSNKSVSGQYELFKTSFQDKKLKVEGDINEDGLLYFICLFLSRGQISSLLSVTKGFKRNDDLAFEAKLWIYRCYACKEPNAKLRSVAMSKEGLFLDILGELQKCPNELFKLLSGEDKEKFDYGSDSYLNENEDLIENTSLHKRYENRFPYLALRILDSLNFPNLRFQLTLGKISMKKYEKMFMDKTIDRALEKEVKVFDKLENYNYENDLDDEGNIVTLASNKLINAIKRDTNPNNILIKQFDQGTKNNWIQFAPRYNIVNNTIGIKLNSISINQLTEKDERNKFGFPKLEQEDAILGIYDLPQLLYYAFEYKNNLSKVEDYISGYINRYQIAFNEQIEEKGAADPTVYKRNYPKPIFKLLTHTLVSPRVKAETIANQLIEENYNLQKQAGKWLEIAKNKTTKAKNIRNNRPAQPNYRFTVPKGKRGTIATWLAKDIIKFCDTNTRSKIGSYMANDLQENIAFYNKQGLVQLLQYKGAGNEWPNSIVTAHPFVKEIIDCNSLFEFYQAYLKKRLALLTYNLTLLNKGLSKTIFPNLFGLKLDVQSLKSYLEPFKTPQNHLTVNLEKGVFNKKVQAFFDDGNPVSANFSFNYQLAKQEPALQGFYGYNKNYIAFNEKNEIIEEYQFEDIQKAKQTVSKALFKTINNNETQIRQRQTEDRMLFYAAKQLSVNIFEKDIFEDFDLNSVFGDNIFNKRIDMLFSITKSSSLPKIKANVVLKDAGKFTKLLVDKRIQKLLEYYPKGTPFINYYNSPQSDSANANFDHNENYQPNLDDELSIYEKARDEMFNDALALEAYIAKWATDNNKQSSFFDFYNREGYYSHGKDYIYPIQTLLDSVDSDINTIDRYKKMLNLMAHLRNNISHNSFFEYQNFETMNSEILNTIEKKEKFLNFGLKIIEKRYDLMVENLPLKENLSQVDKEIKSQKEQEKTKALKIYFTETCNSHNRIFIAAWWMIAYKFLIEELKNVLTTLK